jgi:two-component system chemotaxis response regulator CheY
MPTAILVDDEPQMAKAVQMFFKLLKYQTQYFQNAKEFAQYLLAAPTLPDVVLLDMNMPQVTGLEILKWLRGSERFKDLPVIVLSSETQPQFVDSVIAAGANEYLLKPTTLDDLEKALQKLLGNSPQ